MAVVAIATQQHPWYKCHLNELVAFRQAYEGGREFVKANLKRYSKRETKYDFDVRLSLAHNPGQCTRVVNSVRNSLTAKLHEVERTGDALYEAWAATDVDAQNDTMKAFIGLRLLPLLLAQGRRLIFMDAPQKSAGATRAEDEGKPFVWCVNADDCLSWHMDAVSGHLDAVLVQEMIDTVDENTGLVTGKEKQYRFMRYADSQVTVKLYDSAGKEKTSAVLSGLTRLPVVDVWLVQSLLQDIVQVQVALLQLDATDMSFLFRGNFPLYTQQYDANKRVIKPRESKALRQDESTVSLQNREVDELEEDAASAKQGVGQGVGYQKDLERPGFIGPPTANLTASMDKQKALVEEINILSEMTLTTMAVKALEQSGKSKEIDRIGRDEALAYLGQVLETSEKEIAEIHSEFIGSGKPATITYPTDWTVVSQEDLDAEAKALREKKTYVRSETYQKEIDKRIVQLTLQQTDPGIIAEIGSEIDDADWFDEDPARATVIDNDVAAGVLSPETAADLRGYGADEASKALAAKSNLGDMLSGGIVTAPAAPPV